jgi:hypothetical protein
MSFVSLFEIVYDKGKFQYICGFGVFCDLAKLDSIGGTTKLQLGYSCVNF